MKKFSLIFIPLVLLSALLLVGYHPSNQKKMIACNQTYALCSSAQCIPSPTEPNQVICFCSVENGKNIGYSSCRERHSSKDAEGVRFLHSTFSPLGMNTKKPLFCPAGNPWANCLDKKCTVDPMNPRNAICSCSLMRGTEFVTYGGDGDPRTCYIGFWSGASPEAHEANLDFFLQEKSGPNRSCPCHQGSDY